MSNNNLFDRKKKRLTSWDQTVLESIKYTTVKLRKVADVTNIPNSSRRKNLRKISFGFPILRSKEVAYQIDAENNNDKWDVAFRGDAKKVVDKEFFRELKKRRRIHPTFSSPPHLEYRSEI